MGWVTIVTYAAAFQASRFASTRDAYTAFDEEINEILEGDEVG